MKQHIRVEFNPTDPEIAKQENIGLFISSRHKPNGTKVCSEITIEPMEGNSVLKVCEFDVIEN